MEAILILLGTLVLIPFFILYSSFSWGYVATIISSWFILPIFPQVSELTWIQYAGIMFFINCFVHGSSTANNIKKEYQDEKNSLIIQLIAPWLTLLGAWILHLFY